MPDTWDVIQGIMGSVATTENEDKILNIIRAASEGLSVEPKTDIQKEQLANLAKDWVKTSKAEYVSNINAKVL